MILAHIVEGYLMRLLNPDALSAKGVVTANSRKMKISSDRKTEKDRSRVQVFIDDKNMLARQFSRVR